MNATTGGVRNKRIKALKNLEEQLSTGKKPLILTIEDNILEIKRKRVGKNIRNRITSRINKEDLTSEDIARIQSEINTLKSRI